jgi:hypothetical protein
MGLIHSRLLDEADAADKFACFRPDEPLTRSDYIKMKVHAAAAAAAAAMQCNAMQIYLPRKSRPIGVWKDIGLWPERTFRATSRFPSPRHQRVGSRSRWRWTCETWPT